MQEFYYAVGAKFFCQRDHIWYGTHQATNIVHDGKRQVRGSKNLNPFLYDKYDLKRIEIKRGNGLPIAGTPIDTESNVRIYHNSLSALGFKNDGNKISLEDFVNKFIVTFELTSSQEASKKPHIIPGTNRSTYYSQISLL